MTVKLRPYQFYDTAVSICATCFRRVDAKIVFQDGGVWMLKRCQEHGAKGEDFSGAEKRAICHSSERVSWWTLTQQ